jgi:DNA-binding LytR/AlgR family response regulator
MFSTCNPIVYSVNKTALDVLVVHQKPAIIDLLSEYLQKIDKTAIITETCCSLKEAGEFFEKDIPIDLVFCEANLSDGSAIELFENSPVESPVVFISTNVADAYSAFRVKSTIHFLLEPLKYDDVVEAINRVSMKLSNPTQIRLQSQTYKKRFLVKIGDKFMSKSVDDVAYFYAEGKIVYLVPKTQNRKYIIEQSLDQLEKTHLNPELFYRINRKFIIHIDVIEEVRSYLNSRLKLVLNTPCDLDMIVSREKVVEFKNWLNL